LAQKGTLLIILSLLVKKHQQGRKKVGVTLSEVPIARDGVERSPELRRLLADFEVAGMTIDYLYVVTWHWHQSFAKSKTSAHPFRYGQRGISSMKATVNDKLGKVLKMMANLNVFSAEFCS
jgi:hypothetical protein